MQQQRSSGSDRRQAFRFGALAALALALAGCAGTSRFDGLTSSPARAQPPAQGFQSPPPVTSLPSAGAVSTAPVESQPLPPPSYPAGSPPPVAGQPGQVATSDVPATPPMQPAQPQPIGAGTGTQVATLGSGTSGGRGPVTNRDGVVGGWTAREANGSSCKVLLSSSPALDLYRASASSCANKELQKVTSWELRDGEVYLYQPGGAVAARMRVNDGSSLSGAVTRSGAGLTLSR